MVDVQVRLFPQQGFWCFLEMLLIFPILEIFENAARIVLVYTYKRVLLRLVYLQKLFLGHIFQLILGMGGIKSPLQNFSEAGLNFFAYNF